MEPLDDNATLLTQLEKHAGTNPDKAAYIFVDKDLAERVITRREVWNLTRKCAASFKRLGFGKGDIVCNTLVNSPERLISYFGTTAAGATTINGELFLADGADLIRNLKESKSKFIIYDPNIENGAGHILEKIKYKDETTGSIRYRDLPNLNHLIKIKAKDVEAAHRWINTIDKETEMFFDGSVSNSDTAIVFVTSGTTGFSKLVPHSHKSILRSAWNTTEFLGLHQASKYGPMLNIQYLGWVGGFPCYYTAIGGTRLLIDMTNGLPEDIPMGVFLVKICNQFSPIAGFILTRDLQHLMEAYGDGFRLNLLFDTVLTGAGPISSVTMEALGKITKKIVVGYAATEFIVAAGINVTKISDFTDVCVGRAIESTGVKIRVVNHDGNDMPVGQHGEIIVCSETLFKGYMNNQAKTAESFTQDGWYKTGDLGYFNKEGLLFVLGRMGDAINRDGWQHYPGWMEQRINRHPGIANCVVIGIPDPNRHEDICLCYKPVADCDITVDDVREHCKALFLCGDDVKMSPLPTHYLVFDEFITNHNGKVDRKKMREEVLKRLNFQH